MRLFGRGGHEARDRLLAEICFSVSNEVHVKWLSHDSISLTPVDTTDEITLQRCYLTALHFGSLLTESGANRNLYSNAQRSVSTIARDLFQASDRSNPPVPLNGYELVPSVTASIRDRYRKTIYSDRKGRFADRADVELWEPDEFGVLTILALLASNQVELTHGGFGLCTYTLLGVDHYYRSLQGRPALGTNEMAVEYAFEQAKQRMQPR